MATGSREVFFGEQVQGYQASRASLWTLYFSRGGKQEKDAPTRLHRMFLQTLASDAKAGRSVEKHVLLVLESPARTSCSTSLPAGPDHFLLSINPQLILNPNVWTTEGLLCPVPRGLAGKVNTHLGTQGKALVLRLPTSARQDWGQSRQYHTRGASYFSLWADKGSSGNFGAGLEAEETTCSWEESGHSLDLQDEPSSSTIRLLMLNKFLMLQGISGGSEVSEA